MSGAGFVLRLAWRESRASGRPLAVLVAAVAVGVGSLVAVHSFTDALRSSVREQARVLLGADLAVSSNTPFTEAVEKQIAAVVAEAGAPPGGVARVSSFGAMAWAPGHEGTRLCQVTAVEGGYPFYGARETDPPGLWSGLQSGGGVLVDPGVLAALGAGVGDTLALGEARLPIRGVVRRIPGDVGLRSAFGPRVFMAARDVAATGLVRTGSRVRHEVFLALPAGADAERLARRFRAPLSRERATLRTVEEGQRNLGDQLGRLSRYLGLVALVSVLLGGVAVSSATRVLIRRREESIAVLRCLGATGPRLLAAYLVQALAVGLLGSLLGSALGSAAQWALPRLLADLLPVDVALQPSGRAVALGLAIGLWVTASFALLPLLDVREVSPMLLFRRALEPPRPKLDLPRAAARALLVLGALAVVFSQAPDPGTGAVFAAGVGAVLLLLWLSGRLLVLAVRRLVPAGWPYPWRQGLANLQRPANQTAPVVLALGFGVFLLATLMVVQRGLLEELRLDRGPRRANLAFFDVQPDQLSDLEVELRRSGLDPSPAVPIVPMRLQSLKGVDVSRLLPAKTAPGSERGGWALRREYRSTYRDEPTSAEKRVEGRRWAKGAWSGRPLPGPGEEPVPVSLEVGLARELGLAVGDQLVWDVQGVPVPSVVAELREVDWVRFEPNFFVVFPEGALQEAPRTFLTLGRTDDVAGREALLRRLVERFPNITALDLSQVQAAMEALLARVAQAIRFTALFSLATGVVVLAGTLATTRKERVREGAVLKAMGATRRQVLTVVLAEHLALGSIAVGAGILLASASGWALMRWLFEARLSLPAAALAGLAAAVVAVATGLGLAASADMFRRPALETLREE